MEQDDLDKFDKWEDTGLEIKSLNVASTKSICPKCSHTRTNKREKCVSVNIADKVFNCKHCGWKGCVKKYKQGEATAMEPRNQKVYKKPEFNYQEPSEKMQQWFLEKRGIKPEVLTEFLIYPKQTYIGAAGGVVPCIGFPYIEDSEIVNIKSRYDYFQEKNGEKVAKKTFGLEKDGKLTLYNVDAVKGQKRVMITEGEIDVLSVHQSGFKAVCSVPNGAPPITRDEKGEMRQINLEYLDNASDVFAFAEEIIIATDGDEVGIRLRNEIARRLGRWRCRFIEWPEGYKDFNEILVTFGEEAIQQMTAVGSDYIARFPVEGVVTIDDVWKQVQDYYENGMPKGKTLGFNSYDKQLTYREGEVTTLTGVPSHGKSEWQDEVTMRLTERYDWKHALFAAENGGAALHTTRLLHRFCRKPFLAGRYPDERITQNELTDAMLFLREYYHWIDMRKSGTKLDRILDIASELVLNKGIKSLSIDPYNCLENERPMGISETEWISRIYTKLVGFAEDHDCHVFLIAHPTKMGKDDKGKTLVPSLYDIAGSANFYNKTFNGQTVYRDFEADVTRVITQKVKFDFVGKVGFTEFKFNQHERRYEELI